MKNSFVVAAADHGYCDGAAHQRKALFRSSTYDTGVFALCSPKAQSTVAGKRFRAQNGAVFERDVREAFAGARLSEGALVKHAKHAKPKTAAAAARGGKSDEKKKRKNNALFDGDGGEREKDEKDETEKTEKKRENKAAKKRRKRREEKAKQEKKALSADAGNATKTETSDGTQR